MAIVLGRPLITLNYNQLDKEASFRSGLIQVRENAESIMLERHEPRQAARLLHRLEDLVDNLRRIIAVNRNLGFFTTGYNWMIQIIPALIVAPAFIDGEIDFGAITQSAMAFTALVAAFPLIVTQFQSLSSFAAVVARLSSLMEAIEQAQTGSATAIEIVGAEDRLACHEHLDLEVVDQQRSSAQGLVHIDPVRDPRSGDGVEPGGGAGAVQGNGRGADGG